MSDKSLLASVIAEAKEYKKILVEEARLKFAESITPELKAMLEASLKENEDADADDVDGDTDPEEKEAPKVDEAKKEEDGEEQQDEALDIDAALAEIEKGQVAESDDEDADDVAKKVPTEDDEEAGSEEDETPAAEDETLAEDEIDEDYISRIMAEIEEGDDEDKNDVEEVQEVKKEEEEEGQEELSEDLLHDALPILSTIAGIGTTLAAAFWKDYKNAKTPEEKINVIKGLKNLPQSVDTAKGIKEAEVEDEAKEEEGQEELSELRAELFEMNLLSAKLMYQNKLLISENFSDQQKVRIITAFDKVKTVNEAKLIFETLDIKAKKPAATPISESLGFKRIGHQAPVVADTKKAYDPTDPFIMEMQRKAGIIK